MTKSERTRQFIIEQSAAIINKKGMAGTAISDVMEVTRLAKGGIYGNFESKEEICAEVFEYLTQNVGRGLDAAMASKQTAREKLYALLDYYTERVASSETGGCPLLNFGVEADDTSPDLRNRVAKAVKRSQQRIARLIEEGQESGEFDNDVDAKLFALKMFTMIEGAIFSARVTNSKTLMKTVADILKKEIDHF